MSDSEKRFKAEKDIKWKYEGNQKQYSFNEDILEQVEQAMWGLKNSKPDYVMEMMNEMKEKLAGRNKMIRIADTSEGGWETVRQYETHPLANDSEDESRLTRAEARAIKKKNAQKKKPKSFNSASRQRFNHSFGPYAKSIQLVGRRMYQ